MKPTTHCCVDRPENKRTQQTNKYSRAGGCDAKKKCWVGRAWAVVGVVCGQNVKRWVGWSKCCICGVERERERERGQVFFQAEGGAEGALVGRISPPRLRTVVVFSKNKNKTKQETPIWLFERVQTGTHTRVWEGQESEPLLLKHSRSHIGSTHVTPVERPPKKRNTTTQRKRRLETTTATKTTKRPEARRQTETKQNHHVAWYFLVGMHVSFFVARGVMWCVV